jgi:UDP:flavonoid glycosyltransferase YjiC (YdhE family)
VVFYAMGYRGDVLPFVAIARAMGEAGHDVPFVVPREFHPLLRDEPFRCIHSGTDSAPTTLAATPPTSRAGGIASVA